MKGPIEKEFDVQAGERVEAKIVLEKVPVVLIVLAVVTIVFLLVLAIDAATGRVRAIAEPGRRILADCGLRLEPGDAVTLDALRRFTARMADLTVELIEGTALPLAQQLYLTPPAPVSGRGTVLMFSGGIGHYYYTPAPVNTAAEVATHGDVGPLLADAIRRPPAFASYRIVPPAETMRATVLGSCPPTVPLSGSTTWAQRAILPASYTPLRAHGPY